MTHTETYHIRLPKEDKARLLEKTTPRKIRQILSVIATSGADELIFKENGKKIGFVKL